jgi:hypothetical protein
MKYQVRQKGMHALHIANALLNIPITKHNNIRRNGEGLFTPGKGRQNVWQAKSSHY